LVSRFEAVIFNSINFSLYLRDVTVPSTVEIKASYLGVLASNNSSTLVRPCVISHHSFATQPVWKVRIVNCVPGSQIDWAAIIQTGFQILTISL
jgi:hypothetical protein